jgi:hypothetical protein
VNDSDRQNTAATELMKTLQQCEALVWDALVNGDFETDSAALHRDFLGVYPDGFANKSDHVDQLNDGPSVVRYALSDFRLRKLGHDHAVLSYRADYLRTGKIAKEAMYVSSIWQREADGWLNILSQDTPAKD